MAPRAPVPLREIVYTLSPYEQNIFKNMFYNWPHTVSEFVKEKAAGVALATGILYGCIAYAKDYKEQEKLSHRY